MAYVVGFLEEKLRISEEGSIGNWEYEAAYQVELEKVRGKPNQE